MPYRKGRPVPSVALVEPDCVRRLLESPDPDTAVVFVRGECVVLGESDIDERHRRLVIVRRRDLPEVRSGAPITDELVESVMWRIDHLARDFCG